MRAPVFSISFSTPGLIRERKTTTTMRLLLFLGSTSSVGLPPWNLQDPRLAVEGRGEVTIHETRRTEAGMSKLRWIAALALCAAHAAFAQSWPAKPIRIIVPFTPGSGTDIIARTVTERLSP